MSTAKEERTKYSAAGRTKTILFANKKIITELDMYDNK
jgi:hypothetical protein